MHVYIPYILYIHAYTYVKHVYHYPSLVHLFDKGQRRREPSPQIETGLQPPSIPKTTSSHPNS